MGNTLYLLFKDYIIIALRELLFRLEDNIKMELQEVWWDMAWIDIAQDMDRWRVLVNGVMNIRAP
jgi:hypothetical protein